MSDLKIKDNYHNQIEVGVFDSDGEICLEITKNDDSYAYAHLRPTHALELAHHLIAQLKAANEWEEPA